MFENVKTIEEKEKILEKYAILQDKGYARDQIRRGNLTWERYIEVRWSVFNEMVKRKGIAETAKSTQRAKTESELVKEMQEEAIRTKNPLTAGMVKERVYGEKLGVKRDGLGIVLLVFIWVVVLWYLLLGRIKKG